MTVFLAVLTVLALLSCMKVEIKGATGTGVLVAITALYVVMALGMATLTLISYMYG